MTDAELTTIEQRAAAATPGEWLAERDALGHWRIVWPHSQNSSVLRGRKVFSDEDIAFICAARADVPALAEELRWYRAELFQIIRAIVEATRQPESDSSALEEIMAAVRKLTISAKFRAALTPAADR